jgi:GNAT superfamily N-acetyltransferase
MDRDTPARHYGAMEHSLVVTDATDPRDWSAILQSLVAFNARNGPPTAFQPLAVLIKDPQFETLGGLWGRTAYDWLFIELLFVPEAMRGRSEGSKIVRKAEQIARERGCVGAWVDTFSFQSRPFYERLGYSLFGQIDDHPVGGARWFLQKRFDREDAAGDAA